MIIGLFEDAKAHYGFLPITRTRPLWQVWWGIDRLIDKWARYYGWQVAAQWHASPLLHPLYPYKIPVFETAEDARRFLWINARLLPWTPDLPRLVESLPPQSAYVYRDEILLLRGMPPTTEPFAWTLEAVEKTFTLLPWPEEVTPVCLEAITDLFQQNGAVIEADWRYLSGRSAPLPAYPAIRGKDNIYLSGGAVVDWAFLDATDGPLYIGPGAHIQDAVIIGHHNTIGPKSIVTSGTRLRTHNSIGPLCKIGGEIGQSTFLGFSNKVHEGFMGHSIIGEWCNIGAGSNTSNLKNTYGSVRLYDIASGEVRDTGLQFCGLIMGDYARCGIQTAFTTGCVVDVGANVVGTGFTPKYVPAFYWANGEVWDLEGFLRMVERVKARRGEGVRAEERMMIEELYRALVGS